MQSIKTSVNLHRILEFAFRKISLDKLLLSPSHRFSNYQITKGHFGLSERRWAYWASGTETSGKLSALKEIWPLRSLSTHMLWLQQQLWNGKREKKTRARVGLRRRIPISCQTSSGPVQGSTFVPLFQLKVPPRIVGPPICPGPYAPAYTDVTPLLGRNILGGSHRSHLASQQYSSCC